MMIQLQGLLSTITFLDVIDIVVVAYFLYRLFLMLKNTRAATLGKGLMVLIGFTLICRWLNLHVISWLLEFQTFDAESGCAAFQPADGREQ